MAGGPTLAGGIGGFLALAGAALLLVVSVGVPTWREVYFLGVKLRGGCTIKLGPFGYCTACGASESCSIAQLGYHTSWSLARLGGPRVITLTKGTVTAAFILHPLACGFAAFAFLLSLTSHLATHVLGSAVAGLACFLALVALGFDLGICLEAQRRLRDVGIRSALNAGVWLTLAAVVCLLGATWTICCTGLRHRQRAHAEH